MCPRCLLRETKAWVNMSRFCQGLAMTFFYAFFLTLGVAAFSSVIIHPQLDSRCKGGTPPQHVVRREADIDIDPFKDCVISCTWGRQSLKCEQVCPEE